ncbi:hypothetical protein T484DRAFT_3635803, partial [Baffinella frigidus]
LNPQPCTLYPTPSTLNPTPSTLHPQPSTLHPQPSTLSPEPHTLPEEESASWLMLIPTRCPQTNPPLRSPPFQTLIFFQAPKRDLIRFRSQKSPSGLEVSET